MSSKSSISSHNGSIGSGVESNASSISKHNDDSSIKESGTRGSKGLDPKMAAFFMIAQMAGAGFLSLPRAMADTGWIGVGIMCLFCVTVGFAATRLGHCWVILEQRYPEYSEPVRQPYQEIAYKSLGVAGRRVCLVSVVINLFGSGTVFLILISQMLNEIIRNALEDGGKTPNDYTCSLIIIVACFLIPFTWLGSPKDFWVAPILAVAVTIVAVIVIFSKLFIESKSFEYPEYPNPTIGSFFLGFGPIVFSFGGASVFPTIQNDMKDRDQFWKSVIIAFLVIQTLYFPVAIAGYAMMGDRVGSNILTSLPLDVWVQCAMCFQIVNLLGTYLITFNPVAQSFEDIFNVPTKFGIKRIIVRTSIVVIQIIVGLAVPDFGKVLNLIGGSVITIITFILPPLMYIKLCDNKGDWINWDLPMWERIYLIEMMIVGSIGGISSTITSFIAILDPDALGDSCFVSFLE